MVTRHPAGRKVGVKQRFDVVNKGVLHIQPCWLQFKGELADIEEDVLPLRDSEAKFDEAILLVFFQGFAGDQETLHPGILSRVCSLSLADQDSKMEIRLVIKLVVQLQVSAVDFHTVKLEEAGGRLFPGRRAGTGDTWRKTLSRVSLSSSDGAWCVRSSDTARLNWVMNILKVTILSRALLVLVNMGPAFPSGARMIKTVPHCWAMSTYT